MSSGTHPQAAIANLQTGARVALLGLIINVALATAKILAGVIGNAYVLIADGIESAFDIAGSIVIWGGLRFAARPPDATHPYGHGKAEPLAAIFVAWRGLFWAFLLWGANARTMFFSAFLAGPFPLVVFFFVLVLEEKGFSFVVRFRRV